MKQILLFGAALLAALTLSAAPRRVASPNGRIVVTAGVDKGRPYYAVARDGESVIGTSYLGFLLQKEGSPAPLDAATGFSAGKARTTAFDETWEQPWGEQRLVRNHYNELTLPLKGAKGLRIDLVVRAYDDGFAFRYVFPEQKGLGDFRILEEKTEFALAADAPAWSIPADTHYYEAVYTREPVSAKGTVCTPLTIEAGRNLYLSIQEADLTDYASLTLTPEGTTLHTGLVPWQDGTLVYASAPFRSPWRMVVMGDTPGDLVVSRLALNLNEPCRIDTSWLETGRYVGVWWEMHLQKSSWFEGPRHGATTANTRRYIDFAAAHGFKGVLVEGWNEGWQPDYPTYGYQFSFTKPYPDYDLEGLAAYAAAKGVRLIAHNETGGWTRNYEDQLEEAFALYHRLGIKAIKTGYVNTLLDGKELPHSQYGVRHMRKVLETAARHEIMVVNHEPQMPSGLRRTYPNMVSGEGVRGQEWNAWNATGGNPPQHIVTLPFTRGLAGPMDFTPGILDYDYNLVPGTRPNVTIAKQLAEYVVLYAPWQMAADLPENYEHQPAFTFIESCPTDWETTLVPLAEIGKYVVTVRQERGTDNWFVGAMTDAEARTLTLPLTFLAEGTDYVATLYEDGPDADYETHPYPLTIRRLQVHASDTLTLRLARSGGAAIRIEKR